MASTRSRPRGREQARPPGGGVASEHAAKITTVVVVGVVVVVAFLALTSVGHVIDAATQHFMLYYAGVFALITLCASVGLGLVATDRMFLNPGRRVVVQSAHRAASFGAVAFLIVHILTEILAQRVHMLDAVIPFLSPFRTFYIGLGTIASDLVILLVITGILRGRFNAHGKAWRWRAIHYTSYLAFVFGVWHGLLGGRPGKPYVDWSYGFVVALVLLGLAVRVLSNSLRPKESLSAPPVDQSASSASAPLPAAMLAQYGAARGARNGILGAGTGALPALSAPLGAPVLTALPAGSNASDPGRPYYEPGYEGPPRYLGAPRAADSGPIPRANSGALPRAGTGSMPRANSGPMPRAGTGPMPRAATGPIPRAAGPMPPTGSGPMPRAATGPMPYANSGPMPRAATGPMLRSATGPFPTASPRPEPWAGPMPRGATGPLPEAGDGRRGHWEPEPRYRLAGPQGSAGPAGDGVNGYQSRQSGPMPRYYERPATSPAPQAGYPAPSPGYPDDRWNREPSQQGGPYSGRDGGWHPEEPPWDVGFAETDPNLRYREPGPGMPGYRGSREHRYGGDQYR